MFSLNGALCTILLTSSFPPAKKRSHEHLLSKAVMEQEQRGTANTDGTMSSVHLQKFEERTSCQITFATTSPTLPKFKST
ncbi:hypothetical protein WMY93_026403 [Mugilogobius chulae]|uniref:Secreted protein n=1 Tax=Mugilogobius chulae TaxID=88201 RepID=A0AAW0N9Z0_9GOBI